MTVVLTVDRSARPPRTQERSLGTKGRAIPGAALINFPRTGNQRPPLGADPCLLLGVKRTSKSEMSCPLLTQSGHPGRLQCATLSCCDALS